MDSILSPELIALGPMVFAVVAFVRRLTAKPDGTYRVDGIVSVSILSLLVSIAVVFWAFPASTMADLVRRIPALFLIAVGGTQGLKRILGTEDIPLPPPPASSQKMPMEPPPDPPAAPTHEDGTLVLGS